MSDMNKDLEFLQKQFEQDGLKAPASLSEENIRGLLGEQMPVRETVHVSAKKAADAAGEAGSVETARAVGAVGAVSGGNGGSNNGGKGGRFSRRNKWQRSLVAAVACICLIVGLSPMMPNLHFDSGVKDGTPGSLETFTSYKELDKKLAGLFPEPEPVDYMTYEEIPVVTPAVSNDATAKDLGNADAPDVAAAPETASATPNDSGSAPGSADRVQDHSDTYVQVEGIDEADVVKTDGRYIYFVSSNNNSIVIAKAEGGKATIAGKIRCDKDDLFVTDLYIRGDRVIAIGSTDHEDLLVDEDYLAPGSVTYRNATEVAVYDISDVADPTKVMQYSQGGSLCASRLNGNTLYLITNDYFNYYTKGGCYPEISYGGGWDRIPVQDISCFPHTTVPAYTIIGTLDVTADKADAKTVKTQALLGGTGDIYCSAKALYVTSTVYPEYGVDGVYELPADDSVKTCILKVDITGDEPVMEGTVTVRGYLNNQFSMDDANDIFKVATTSTKDGHDVNHLFLFDKDMELLGMLKNFGKDEHIEAVRYVGDLAYVITYEQIDPLFIIDLSDPTDPDILGHVKISGFSTLLVPVNDEYLLGLGYSTEANEWGEGADGLKAALFDISAAKDPKVADSLSFKGMDSPVQEDHKALLVGPNASYYAFPYETWNTGDDSTDTVIVEDAEGPATVESTEPEDTGKSIMSDNRYGVMVIGIKDGKLVKLHDFKTKANVVRCIYLGDYIYAICDDDTIEGFKVK